MKKFLLVCLAGVACVSVLVGACNKKSDQEEKTTPTVEQTAQATAAKPTGEPEDPAKAIAAAMAQAAQGIDTSDAPEHMKKLVEHIKEINRLTKENLSDCNKVVKAVSDYAQKNQKEMDSIRTKMESEEAKMDDAHKMKMAQQMMALMGPMFQEMAMTQSEFAQKCAAQAQEIEKIMKGF